MRTATLETPPAAPDQAPRALPTPGTPPRPRGRTFLLALGIFAVALFFNTFRSMETIDLQSDEATYTIESVALQQTGITRWNGTPFYVHPPVYFLIEGLYFKLRGIGQGVLFHRLVDQPYHDAQALLPPTAPLESDNMTTTIAAGRLLPAVYGALLAVLLFLLGRTFLVPAAGWLAAALFIFDPYVLRRNHFNMLEPLAALFGMLLIYVYYRGLGQQDPARRRRFLIGAGVLLGLALLSKELAGIYIVALAVHWLLFRRAHIGDLLTPVGIGLGMYSLFPLWALVTGNWGAWWATKQWLFLRLTGQIQDTGITRPNSAIGRSIGINILDYLPSLTAKRFLLSVADYLPSFLILGLAGLAVVIFLYLFWRRGLRDRPAQLLTALVLGCYGFFAVVWKFGGVINEQFFYFVMPASVMTLAYAAVRLPQLWAGLQAPGREQRPGGDPFVTRALPWVTTDPRHSAPTLAIPIGRLAAARLVRRLATVALGFVLMLLVYDFGAAVVRYGFSQDNSYQQVDGFLAQAVPPGTPIAGRDAVDIYLLPRNPVYTFGFFPDAPSQISPSAMIENKIPYAILNDQSLLERYGGANPSFYKWAQANGTPAYAFAGRIWNTQVYQFVYSRPGLAQAEVDSLAAHHPAVASSTEDAATLGAANAFDANVTTRWASATSDNQWIYVDLGAVKSIRHVNLTWETAYAAAYDIQVSDNARDWTTVYSTDKGQGGYETVDLTAQGRYVRVLLRKRGTKWGYSLWEVGIYP